MTTESPEFEQFIYDPSIPKNKKVPALNAILGKMEISEVTKQFFGAHFDMTTSTYIPLVNPATDLLPLAAYRGAGHKQQAQAVVQYQ